MALTATQYVNTYSAFQTDIESRIFADVNRAYGEIIPRRTANSLVTTRPIMSKEELIARAMLAIVVKYGPIAVAFGTHLFQQYTQRKAVSLLDDYGPQIAGSAVSLMRKSPEPKRLLQGSMSRHVLNRARGSIHDSVAGTRDMAYARVPHYVGQRHGAGPCEFCLILASRGPIYATDVSAGGRGVGAEYHDDCYCVPVPMRKASGAGDQGHPEDWPDGYNPRQLYDELYGPHHVYGDRIQDVTARIRAKDSSF